MKSQIAFINKKEGLAKGFTLVEIIVVVALITIIFAFGAFANVNLFTRQISLSEESALVGVLQKVRSRAMNNIDASRHGVHIEDGSDYYIIYREFPYNAINITNEKFWREKKVVITSSGNISSDVVFEQLSGNTVNDGMITLLDTGGQTKVITIAPNGLIDW